MASLGLYRMVEKPTFPKPQDPTFSDAFGRIWELEREKRELLRKLELACLREVRPEVVKVEREQRERPERERPEY